MYQLYSGFLEMLAAAVFLIPVFCLYVRTGCLDKKAGFSYLLFACYLSAVFALVGIPNVTYVRFDVNLNLIPFADMIPDFKNACLNVLLFVPLGIFLPLFWERFREGKSAVLAGMALSCLIEFLQVFTFRATDVNDLITNTLGALIGFLLARCVTRNFRNYVFRNQTERTLGTVFLTVLAVMLFGQPFASRLIWEWLR